jgi:hypothetical protein
MWKGGLLLPLGVELDAHGSGAPGKGVVGSNAVISIT